MDITKYYGDFLKDPGLNGSINSVKDVLKQQISLCETEIKRMESKRIEGSKKEVDPNKINKLKSKVNYYNQLHDNIEKQLKMVKEEIMPDLQRLLKLDLNLIKELDNIGIKNIYTLLKTDNDYLRDKLGKTKVDDLISKLHDFAETNKLKISVSLKLKDILELDQDISKKLSNLGITDIFSLLLIDEKILTKELGEEAVVIVEKAKKILKEVIVYKESIGDLLGLSPATTAKLIVNGITKPEDVLKTGIWMFNFILGPVETQNVINKARKHLEGQTREPEIGIKIKDIKLEGLTVKELTSLCTQYSVAVPSGAKKSDIIKIVQTQLADKEVMIERP